MSGASPPQTPNIKSAVGVERSGANVDGGEGGDKGEGARMAGAAVDEELDRSGGNPIKSPARKPPRIDTSGSSGDPPR